MFGLWARACFAKSPRQDYKKPTGLPSFQPAAWAGGAAGPSRVNQERTKEMNSFIQWRRGLTLRALLCGVALVGAVALITDRVASQDKEAWPNRPSRDVLLNRADVGYGTDSSTSW